MSKKCHFTGDHHHCGQSLGVVVVLVLRRRNGVDDAVNVCLNGENTELLFFACMPLKYATKNNLITESEISLKEGVSQVTVTYRGPSWAVGNAVVVLINFLAGKYPQKSWPMRQAGWAGSGGSHSQGVEELRVIFSQYCYYTAS